MQAFKLCKYRYKYIMESNLRSTFLLVTSYPMLLSLIFVLLVKSYLLLRYFKQVLSVQLKHYVESFWVDLNVLYQIVVIMH